MTHPSRTDRHTMKIRDTATGLVIERQPPDAFSMVEGGTHEFVDAAVPSLYETVRALGVRRMRELLSYPTAGTSRDYLIRTLVQKVERGEIELPEPPELVA